MEGLGGEEILSSGSEYLNQLSHFNEEILLCYFDKELVIRLMQRKATEAECKFVRETIEKNIFVSVPHGELYDVMENDKARFRELTGTHTQDIIAEKADLIGSILELGVVPVIVRPDLLYLAPQVIAFLEESGFEVVYTKSSEISLDQYWALYSTEFTESAFREGLVRQRAFRYINRPTCILFVRQTKRGFVSSACAQLIQERYKGRAGVKDNSTLRGSIFYDETSRILEKNDKHELFAVDPLMETVYGSYDYVQDAETPLHAHIQGIHVPEPNDVAKDLSVLLSRAEMQYIQETLT